MACVDTNLDLEPPNGEPTIWAWRNFLRTLKKVNEMIVCLEQAELRLDGAVFSEASPDAPEGARQVNSGTVSVNFGAFPGATHTTIAVTGQAGILATSSVLVTVAAIATVDHTADEHVLEPIDVYASDIVEGVGFTINAVSRAIGPATKDALTVTRLTGAKRPINGPTANSTTPSGNVSMPYGKYSVSYIWY